MTRSASQPGMDLLQSLEGTCPYPGLCPFQAADAPYFFGREQLTQTVLERLQRVGRDSPAGTVRMFSVVGPAGSGKTSLLHAGVLDALHRNQLGLGDWPVLVLRPGEDPVAALAHRLSERFGGGPDLTARLCDDQRTLHEVVQAALENAPASRRVVIAVDCCEDLTTLCPEGWRRFAFVNNLAFAAGVADGKTVVMLLARDESAATIQQDGRLAIAFDQPIHVGPLFADELRQAIEMPARAARCSCEPGLVERLITDFARSGGSLLKLQHVLRETWRGRDGWVLSNAAYERAGGIAGAVAKTADTIQASLSPAEQEVLRRLALRFVQPGDGSIDNCRAVSRAELLGIVADESVLAKPLDALTETRFLNAHGEPLELAHETLLDLWPALAAWRQADREALRVHRRLTLAANRWELRGRDERQLFRGELLAQSQAWFERHGDEANHREQQFLAASRAKEQLLTDAAFGQAQRMRADSLQQNLQAAVQGRREAERLARQFESRATDAETGLARAERDLADARQTLAGLRGQLQVTEECAAQLERRVVSMDQDRETLSQAISARMSEVSRLEEQLRTVRERESKAGATLARERESERELLSAAISARMTEVSRLEQRLAEATATRPAAVPVAGPAASVDFEADRELLSAVISARMTECGRLERRLLELSSVGQRIASLAAERDASQQETSAAQTRILALEQSAAALQKSADAARQSTIDAERRHRQEMERQRQEVDRQKQDADRQRQEAEKQRGVAEDQRKQNRELSKSMFWSNSIAIVAVVMTIVFLILWQSNNTRGVQRLSSGKRSRVTTTVPTSPAPSRSTTTSSQER